MKIFLKSVYGAIPLKKEIFSLLKIVWQPSENTYKHLHFQGVFEARVDEESTFKVKNYGHFLENEIFWGGLERAQENVSYGLWKKLARKSDVIFDIGANTGIYSLIGKSVNPGARVYAFEPVKKVFEKLEKNRQLNNYDFAAFPKALSNCDGDAVIYGMDVDYTCTSSLNKDINGGENVVETKITVERLDTFIEATGLKKIDLMKIDVETHEPQVLEGMGKYLQEFNPAILIEILDDEVGEKVESLVKNNGYVYFNIDEKAGTVRKVASITKSDYWNYLLCSPTTAKELGLV